jgi:oligoribonuclease
MHTASGLKAESLATMMHLSIAEDEFITWLRQQGFKEGEAVIAGNSIGQDRIWIATQMPHLHEFLSYRTIDVSAVRGLIRRWALPGYTGPKGETAHRALPDCLWSRDELALYRRALFGGREAEIVRRLDPKGAE